MTPQARAEAGRNLKEGGPNSAASSAVNTSEKVAKIQLNSHQQKTKKSSQKKSQAGKAIRKKKRGCRAGRDKGADYRGKKKEKGAVYRRQKKQGSQAPSNVDKIRASC